MVKNVKLKWEEIFSSKKAKPEPIFMISKIPEHPRKLCSE